MKTFEQMKPEDFKIKLLAIGGTGEGKTYFSLTFPKCYVISTDPGGLDTVFINSLLRQNMVGYEEIIPKSPEDTKEMFIRLKKALNEAKELNKQGKVDTLVIDSLTPIAEHRYIYTETFEPDFSPRSGEIDIRSIYGKLSRWLWQFTFMDILTFPGNIVVTTLEQREDEETLKTRASKESPIVASILGGFRDKIGAMFSCVMYLSKIKQSDNKFHYFARTEKGNEKQAKNRLGLNEIIEDINYSKLKEMVDKKLQTGGK